MKYWPYTIMLIQISKSIQNKMSEEIILLLIFKSRIVWTLKRIIHTCLNFKYLNWLTRLSFYYTPCCIVNCNSNYVEGREKWNWPWIAILIIMIIVLIKNVRIVSGFYMKLFIKIKVTYQKVRNSDKILRRISHHIMRK